MAEQKDKGLKIENFFQISSIQELISIGYIILITGGMIIEYVEFRPHGINIFSHSDFLDFLIVPFKTMIIGPCILVTLLILWFLTYKAKRKKHQDLQVEKISNEEKKETKIDMQGAFNFICIMFLSMTIGFSFGSFLGSNRAKEKIANGDTNRVINFIDGETKEVYLIGSNNSKLFYYEKKGTEIIICPIAGNVKQIKKIKKKDEQEKKEKSKKPQLAVPQQNDN